MLLYLHFQCLCDNTPYRFDTFCSVCYLGASGGCAKQNNPVTIVYNKYSNTQTSNNKEIFGINIKFIWYWKPTKTAEKTQQHIKRCLYFKIFMSIIIHFLLLIQKNKISDILTRIMFFA